MVQSCVQSACTCGRLKPLDAKPQATAGPQDGTRIQQAIDLDELVQDATTGAVSAVPDSTTDQPADLGAGNEEGDGQDRPTITSTVQPAPLLHGWNDSCYFRGR